MTSGADRWTVRLTAQANADLIAIVNWSRREFGPRQADVYATTLSLALDALAGGPDIPGAKRRDDLMPGVRAIHVARSGRRGRHLIMFVASPPSRPRAIEVIRILHDAMDLRRHLRAPSD